MKIEQIQTVCLSVLIPLFIFPYFSSLSQLEESHRRKKEDNL